MPTAAPVATVQTSPANNTAQSNAPQTRPPRIKSLAAYEPIDPAAVCAAYEALCDIERTADSLDSLNSLELDEDQIAAIEPYFAEVHVIGRCQCCDTVLATTSLPKQDDGTPRAMRSELRRIGHARQLRSRGVGQSAVDDADAKRKRAYEALDAADGAVTSERLAGEQIEQYEYEAQKAHAGRLAVLKSEAKQARDHFNEAAAKHIAAKRALETLISEVPRRLLQRISKVDQVSHPHIHEWAETGALTPQMLRG
ncbi:hypothetical protein KOR34_52250 [Posidoniimonas corsicana]|uniref:Uncharacterized protein n=1 Tax=Posidoniimonas corsicana TaxID=1938618 RepID=A0A5C5UVB6_9BACT|nr:hypothetical protein [Posidoniimonas corsicana]TWT29315.1 hypothetical protein KOR34_52250 [Posidoniimonas corsicana]